MYFIRNFFITFLVKYSLFLFLFLIVMPNVLLATVSGDSSIFLNNKSEISLFLVVCELIGGAGLFIYGMKMMTHALEYAAGSKLRSLLTRLTNNAVTGTIVGTFISFLIHSGATTVMIVGFINSGLLQFSNSIGVIIGANIGTTLSMQIVAFDVGKYCYLAIAIGFVIDMFFKNERIKNIGLIIMGFGILFLGMLTMKHAVDPFKKSEFVQSIFRVSNAHTFTGMVGGILFSTLVTAIMQSSGAMIGIIFALCATDVITDFAVVFPLILGAHIGTCIVTVIGAIGTNIGAKRSALAHVLFNVFGAIIAAALFSLYNRFIPVISGADLVRQTANLHTLVQTINGIIFLIFSPIFIKIVIALSPSKSPEEHGTYLDDALLNKPENAILAAIKELERMLQITHRMIENCYRGFLLIDKTQFKKVELDEEITDKLKKAISDYLIQIGRQPLSARQTLLLQFIEQATIDVERIGDHISKLIEITDLRIKRKIWFEKDDVEHLKMLFKKLHNVLDASSDSINPYSQHSSEARKNLNEALQAYKTTSMQIQEYNTNKIKKYQRHPLESYVFKEYVLCFDRIAKHIKRIITLIENEELFFINQEKLAI